MPAGLPIRIRVPGLAVGIGLESKRYSAEHDGEQDRLDLEGVGRVAPTGYGIEQRAAAGRAGSGNTHPLTQPWLAGSAGAACRR